ncbi:MAG: FkbM family methyltransferase [Rhizobiales bacterium]|nr:FkbM family methyltransferase [Hyphomicrobiales bacterium]
MTSISEATPERIEMPADRLTDDEVRIAFRFAFGREPRQVDIEWHRRNETFEDLRSAFLHSEEFRSINGFDPRTLGRRIAVETATGLTIWVTLDDLYVSRGVIAGQWEPHETTFLSSQLHAGSTFVDVGAFIGWFSLTAAQIVGPAGLVVAFEPQVEAHELLRRSVFHNRFEDRVTTFPLALSDRNSEAVLYRDGLSDAGGASNQGHAWINSANAEDNGFAVRTVQTVKLDDLSLRRKIDAIKIDAEGAEWLVLKGGERTVRASHPVVICELYPRQLAKVSHVTGDDLISLMRDWGYSANVLENDGNSLRAFRPEDMPQQENAYTTVVFR